MKVFYYMYLLLVNAIISLECESKSPLCPDKTQYLTCSIEGRSLQWESQAFDADIEFLGSPVGTIRTDSVFTANISSKNGTKFAVSVLSYPNSPGLCGTRITCRDLSDGISSTCVINTNNISPPSKPKQLSVTQLSYNSVQIIWDSVISERDDFRNYHIKIEPADSAGNCTSGTCNATSTIVYITGLRNIAYSVTVQGVNCAGDGMISENITFNVITLRSFSPSFNVCSVFSLSSGSYLAFVQWKYAITEDAFYPPLLYFVIQVVDVFGNVTLYNISSKHFYHYVVVPYEKQVNISVAGANVIGESLNNQIISLNVSSKVVAHLLYIETNFALIKVELDWSYPCERIVNVAISYFIEKEEDQKINLVFPYHLQTDQGGKTFLLKDLLSNSTYKYNLSVFIGNNSLIAEPINGTFVTLNNETVFHSSSPHCYSQSKSSSYTRSSRVSKMLPTTEMKHSSTCTCTTIYSVVSYSSCSKHDTIKATSTAQNQFDDAIPTSFVTILSILAFISPFLAIVIVSLLTYSLCLKVKQGQLAESNCQERRSICLPEVYTRDDTIANA